MTLETKTPEEIKKPEIIKESKKSSDYDTLGRLLEQNNAMLKEILEISHKTKSYLVTQNIMTVLKILIFVIPIVLSIIFLPPLLKEVIKPYQELLNPGGSSSATSLPVDVLKNYIK